MQCDICFRPFGGPSLPFLCAVDARNRLYGLRVEHARVLLEEEALSREVTASLRGKEEGSGVEGEDHKEDGTMIEIMDLRAERARTLDRTATILASAEELKGRVEGARKELRDRQADLARRRKELASASNGIATRRARSIEDAEKSIRMTRYKWNQAYSITASSRAFLCGEAAKLYGLKRVRRGSGAEEYAIGGVGIVDLRTLNTASPAQISTSLTHIVHLLMLCSHYLAIRLPAEITLPHRDYPLPTIFSLASSHIYSDISFPGSTSTNSSSNSPTDARHSEHSTQPRPRPLFVKKPLPILATEDPATYSLFLEGVTLLAYNIVWLCRSQGVSIGDATSFEDICAIGKNLYTLLIDTQTPVPVILPGSDAENPNGKAAQGTIMGHYSHGTSHTSLASAEGTEFIRGWKLSNPVKLADQLKSMLLSEVANAEWELLDQDAWQVDDDMGDDGVVIGAKKEGKVRGTHVGMTAGMQSFMNKRTVIDALETLGGDSERKPGTSGWTKLKPR